MFQVKELEIIVRRRTHPNFSNVSEIIRSEESRMYEKESEIIKNLKKELLEKQQIILDLKNQIVDSKVTCVLLEISRFFVVSYRIIKREKLGFISCS